MQWIEVTVRTASAGIELLCAELTNAGFDSLVIDDCEEFEDFLEASKDYWDYVDDALAAKMQDRSQVRLYLPEDTAQQALADLRALLAQLPGRYPCDFGPLTIALENVPQEDWENSWKRSSKICQPIVFETKHYLFPIAQKQLNEMKNFTQNQGW